MTGYQRARAARRAERDAISRELRHRPINAGQRCFTVPARGCVHTRPARVA